MERLYVDCTVRSGRQAREDFAASDAMMTSRCSCCPAPALEAVFACTSTDFYVVANSMRLYVTRVYALMTRDDVHFHAQQPHIHHQASVKPLRLLVCLLLRLCSYCSL